MTKDSFITYSGPWSYENRQFFKLSPLSSKKFAMDEVTIEKVGSSYPAFKMLIDANHLNNKAVIGTTK